MANERMEWKKKKERNGKLKQFLEVGPQAITGPYTCT